MKMKKSAKILVALGMTGILAFSACSPASVADDSENTPYIPYEAPTLYETFEAGDDIGIESGPALLSPEDIEAFWASMFDPETVQIIVDGEAIEAPTPFVDSEAGTIMLPLVAIAEALGYMVVDEGHEVIVSPGTMVTEGVNSFARGREMARELTAAPAIHDGAMFVPWEFFHEILSYTAFVEDGNIVLVEVDW